MSRGQAAELLAAGLPGATVEDDLSAPYLLVPPEQWLAAATLAGRDRRFGAGYFDYLTAVDDAPGGFLVLVHLFAPASGVHVDLRTRLDRERPRLASLTSVFPGAGWHERETWEMFGIDFDGHPDLRRLLLAEDLDGHPLRKERVLASRAVTDWPGAVEPGGAVSRRPQRACGQPESAHWREAP